jgi:acetylornithine deacetylase/succinyl-diaminopimelate desuccinylase-like protein
MSVTGAAGLPALVDAGNVLLPFNTLKLSFRLPPTCDADDAANTVKEILEVDTPPLSKVSFHAESTMAGWNAPPVAEWLETSMQRASQAFFGKPSMYMGTGGTIPFMGMLGEKFPEAQFLITGLLGPNSNAHGPNEFLHIDTGKRVTSCVAQVLNLNRGSRASPAAPPVDAEKSLRARQTRRKRPRKRSVHGTYMSISRSLSTPHGAP